MYIAGGSVWKVTRTRQRRQWELLLRFSKLRELWSSKAAFKIFSPPSIVITITSNEPWNKETPKTDRNQPITNHKPFGAVQVNFCFLKTSAKMIDGGEKLKRQLLFELQNSRVLKISVRRNKFNKQQLCAIHGALFAGAPGLRPLPRNS